jgi:hypothetical protein
LKDTGQNLDQRRFPRAVVTDQRDDLAGMNVKVDTFERGDRAELFAHTAQAQ